MNSAGVAAGSTSTPSMAAVVGDVTVDRDNAQVTFRMTAALVGAAIQISKRLTFKYLIFSSNTTQFGDTSVIATPLLTPVSVPASATISSTGIDGTLVAGAKWELNFMTALGASESFVTQFQASRVRLANALYATRAFLAGVNQTTGALPSGTNNTYSDPSMTISAWSQLTFAPYRTGDPDVPNVGRGFDNIPYELSFYNPATSGSTKTIDVGTDILFRNYVLSTAPTVGTSYPAAASTTESGTGIVIYNATNLNANEYRHPLYAMPKALRYAWEQQLTALGDTTPEYTSSTLLADLNLVATSPAALTLGYLVRARAADYNLSHYSDGTGLATLTLTSPLDTNTHLGTLRYYYNLAATGTDDANKKLLAAEVVSAIDEFFGFVRLATAITGTTLGGGAPTTASISGNGYLNPGDIINVLVTHTGVLTNGSVMVTTDSWSYE